jgi:uncharacterized membrane protein HdeD (DUF308 family)
VFVAIAAGVLEFGVMVLAQGWWKLLHAAVAVIFIVAGIVAFIHPGNTFAALAGVFSFFLVLAGTFDIVIAISTRREIEVWWLQLVGSIIELALASVSGWSAWSHGPEPTRVLSALPQFGPSQASRAASATTSAPTSGGRTSVFTTRS